MITLDSVQMETLTSTSHLRFDPEKRIMYVTARAGAMFDVEQVKENKSAALSIADQQLFSLLFITEGEITATPQARQLQASAEFCEGLYAVGLMSSSHAMKILANFYLRINRPEIPTRFFTRLESAEDWLASFALSRVNTL
ncbi:MAG: hypothetical protein IM638_00505 [Bacteroidetes bacterium]|nr:hypothetical protein [Bacteroidota bacterium]